MMKKDITIVGIISSAKNNGNTATLVREALQGAADEGAQIKEIFLPQYKIEYCTGCFSCMAKGKCHISDDFESLRNTLLAADGFIVSSPTYGFAPNAIYKNFVDRLGMFEYYTSSVFGGKYVAGISTADGSGAGKVAKEVAGILTRGVFKRGYVSGTFAANVGGKEIVNNPTALKQARQLGVKIVRDINQGTQYPFQNLQGRLISRFILQPLFRKNVLRDKEGKMKGVYRELKSQGLIQQ